MSQAAGSVATKSCSERQCRGTNNGGTGPEHKSNRGQSLPHQTQPQVQAVQRVGCNMQAGTAFMELHNQVAGSPKVKVGDTSGVEENDRGMVLWDFQI